MNGQGPGHERHAVTFLNEKVEGVARDPIAGWGYFEATAEAMVLEGRAFPPIWGSAVLVLAVLLAGTATNLLGVLEVILVAVIVPLLYLWIGSRVRRLELPYSAVREARYDADRQAVTLIAENVVEGGRALTCIQFRPRKRGEFETIRERLRNRLVPAAAAGGAGAEPPGASPVASEGPGGVASAAPIPAAARARTASSPLAGIRGWLILPAIGFVIGPVGQLFGIIGLVNLSADFRRAGAGGELLTMTVLNIGLLIYMVAVAVAFFRKRRRAPAACMRLLLLLVVLNFVVGVIARHAGALGIAQLQVGVFLVSVLQAIIWIPYFKWSKRVKATFVNEPDSALEQES